MNKDTKLIICYYLVLGKVHQYLHNRIDMKLHKYYTTHSVFHCICIPTCQFTHCHIDSNVLTVSIAQSQSHCDNSLILKNTVGCLIKEDFHLLCKGLNMQLQ